MSYIHKDAITLIAPTYLHYSLFPQRMFTQRAVVILIQANGDGTNQFDDFVGGEVEHQFVGEVGREGDGAFATVGQGGLHAGEMFVDPAVAVFCQYGLFVKQHVVKNFELVGDCVAEVVGDADDIAEQFVGFFLPENLKFC